MSEDDLNPKLRDMIEHKNKQIATLEAKIDELQQSNEVLAQIALMKGTLQEAPTIEGKPTGVI